MRQLLVLILATLVVLPAQSRDPIVPWPLNMVREDIAYEDIAGTWTAVDIASVWTVKITAPVDSKDHSRISLRWSPSDHGFAYGWLNPMERAFLGKVRSHRGQSFQIMIFRNSEGTILRIESGHHQYKDLQLYRTE